MHSRLEVGGDESFRGCINFRDTQARGISWGSRRYDRPVVYPQCTCKTSQGTLNLTRNTTIDGLGAFLCIFMHILSCNGSTCLAFSILMPIWSIWNFVSLRLEGGQARCVSTILSSFIAAVPFGSSVQSLHVCIISSRALGIQSSQLESLRSHSCHIVWRRLQRSRSAYVWRPCTETSCSLLIVLVSCHSRHHGDGCATKWEASGWGGPKSWTIPEGFDGSNLDWTATTCWLSLARRIQNSVRAPGRFLREVLEEVSRSTILCVQSLESDNVSASLFSIVQGFNRQRFLL